MSAYGQEEACATDCQCHDCWGKLQNICHPCICCLGKPHDELEEWESDDSCGYYRINEICEEKQEMINRSKKLNRLR